ncbi:MAG: FkbM family methyltransferase [Candidatus Hodarchaeales archaeon]|jgi:FkbM family methyltransferase
MKVAFVKFGGLSAGGTERFLQNLAVGLPKEKFEVDYYYCDSAPYLGSNYKHKDTDPYRKEFVENSDVNLIKVDVGFKDVRVPTHDWVDTNFWDLFDESKYDVVISGRAGHPEYPFYKMRNVPLINILTLTAGVDNQSNIYRSIHLSEWSGNVWKRQGGDPIRLDIQGIIQEMPQVTEDFRGEYQIKNKFIYGFHQRDSEHISSTIPLEAYKEIESDDTAFLLLGGSHIHIDKAKELKLKNFYHIPHSGDSKVIHKFLNTLDVYSHGRRDGETFGTVFVEAMYHKKPCLSHKAPANGHVEIVGNAGKVVESGDVSSYSSEMLRLKTDKTYYQNLSNIGYERYKNIYSYDAGIDKFSKILNSLNMINNLKKLNLEVNNILDIGAHFGEFAKDIHRLYPNSYILMIEGNGKCEDKLEELPFDHCIALLSDTNKEVDFFLNPNNLSGTGSSYYKENTEHFENPIIERIDTYTVDEVVESTDREFDFVKLDTQGSELDILRGGKNTLKKAKYVLIECGTIEDRIYNEGSPYIDEVIDFMKENNFSTYHVVDEHAYPVNTSDRYSLGEIFQKDLLFIAD